MRRTTCFLVPTLILALTAPAAALELRLATWGWTPDCACSPELDPALDAALQQAAAELGIQAELTRVSEREYWDVLGLLLSDDAAPDLVWISPEKVEALAEARAIVPLDPLLAERPWLVDGLPGETLESFTVFGSLYGLPLGPAGQLARGAWAVTSWAEERGKRELAAELIGFLRDRVPARGLPDLAVSDLAVLDERLRPGDEMRIRLVVANIGDQPAFEVPYRVSVDDEAVLAEGYLRVVAAGDTVPLELVVRVPAEGEHRLTAAVALGPAHVEFNKKNNTSSIPVFSGLDTLALPKLVGSPFVIASQAGSAVMWDQPYVKVAFDGTNYLVVWTRQEPVTNASAKKRIVAARVSSSGTLLDTTPIQVTSSLGWYDHFDVAFDGTNYGVVWVKRLGDWLGTAGTLPNPYSVIAGAGISTAGVLLNSTPISIEASACSGCPTGWSTRRYDVPEIASTGSGFLVTYRTSIYGKVNYQEGVDARLVTSSGTVSAAKRLVTYGSSLESVGFQSLAFNTTTKKGFLLFDGTNYTTSPYTSVQSGVWITLSGSTLTASSPVTIASVSRTDLFLVYRHAAVAAGSSGFLGLFESADAYKNESPYSNRIDLDAAVLGSSSGAASKQATVSDIVGDPAVAFDGNEYTAVFADGGCGAYLSAVRFAANGSRGVQALFQSSGSTDKVEDVDIAFGSSNGLVVYARWNGKITQIVGVLIDRSS